MTDEMNLGRLLGQREAFQIVAARCSAADANLMREIRDGKLYEGHAEDWGDFCARYLHTSRENANRIIRLLDEFGPQYFEVAQLARISPATYRAIAPAIQNHAIEHNGESIMLVPENAEKVATAVAEMRKAVRPAAEPAPDPLLAAERRADDLVAELAAMAERPADTLRLQATLGALITRLKRIELML